MSKNPKPAKGPLGKRIVRGGGAGRKPGDPKATSFWPDKAINEFKMFFGGSPPKNVEKGNKQSAPRRGSGVDKKGPQRGQTRGRPPKGGWGPNDDGDHFREA